MAVQLSSLGLLQANTFLLYSQGLISTGSLKTFRLQTVCKLESAVDYAPQIL